jgi:serine/threonine protein kinase
VVITKITHQTNNDTQVLLLWTAPEILNREPNCYSFASDMFSFGISMWERLTKKLLWKGVASAAITSRVISGQRPPVESDWDNLTTNLVTSSWAQSPDARPTVKQAHMTLENEIIPIVGNLELNSSSQYSFNKKDTPSDSNNVPPPQPPFALVTANITGASKLCEEDPRTICRAVEATSLVI